MFDFIIGVICVVLTIWTFKAPNFIVSLIISALFLSFFFFPSEEVKEVFCEIKWFLFSTLFLLLTVALFI